MSTMHEAQTRAKVEARKRVYVALSEVKRLLSDLDIVPNARDYAFSESFEAARLVHAARVQSVVDLQNAMTADCRALQGIS